MTKLFYDHLVAFEEVVAVVDAHGLSGKEKETLLATVDELLHHHILDEILTHLPQEKHEMFLAQLHQSPHDETLLFFLKQNTTVDIERAITNRARKVKAEILKEIKSATQK